MTKPCSSISLKNTKTKWCCITKGEKRRIKNLKYLQILNNKNIILPVADTYMYDDMMTNEYDERWLFAIKNGKKCP